MVSPSHPVLVHKSGPPAIGCCDDPTRTIYISNTLPGKSISFYEVEVLGYTEIPIQNELVNVFKGKEFVPTKEATYIFDNASDIKRYIEGLK